jgi:hypothetical protein
MDAVQRFPQWSGGMNSWLKSHPKTTNDTIFLDIERSMNEITFSTQLEE